MFNKIIIAGHLVDDVKLRYTTNSNPVADFRVAAASKYKVGNDVKEETLFIDVVVWGKFAETCKEHLQKGKACLVEGRLSQRTWEIDGQKRSKMEINATTVRFL